MSLQGMLRETMAVLAEAPRRAGSGALLRDRWVTRKASIRCDIQPLSSAHKLELLHKNISASHKVFFEHTSVAIEQGDRLRIDGRQFEVLTVEFARRTNWPSSAIVDEVLNDPEN